MHEFLLENVEHAQRKQRKVYATRKGFQTFEGFIENTKIKMRRPGKKRYIFVDYKDGKGFQEQDHGSRICIFKDLKGQCLSRRDLQLYLSAYSCLIFKDIDLFGRSGDTCDPKTVSNVYCRLKQKTLMSSVTKLLELWCFKNTKKFIFLFFYFLAWFVILQVIVGRCW